MQNVTTSRALCVDLDGTLLRSDILYESLLALLAHNPLYLFMIPFWLVRGKAYVKRQLASRVQLPAETLPYDERVLEILRTSTQRPRVLCTASDRLLVQPIADHLGLFEEVMASDGHTNLSGNNKGHALAARFGERGFDYMGNGGSISRSGHTPVVRSWSTTTRLWPAMRPARPRSWPIFPRRTATC